MIKITHNGMIKKYYVQIIYKKASKHVPLRFIILQASDWKQDVFQSAMDGALGTSSKI